MNNEDDCDCVCVCGWDIAEEANTLANTLVVGGVVVDELAGVETAIGFSGISVWI